MSVTIAQNRKARHDYQVLETVEAGIALVGTEVKSCRAHTVALTDAYARVLDDELVLIGAHIAPYRQGNRNNHEPLRTRKLLMHRREIRRMAQETDAKGLTLIPLRMYFVRHKVKVELALCRGRRVQDKRQVLKEKLYREEARQAMARARK